MIEFTYYYHTNLLCRNDRPSSLKLFLAATFVNLFASSKIPGIVSGSFTNSFQKKKIRDFFINKNNHL